jgi:dephospho-CoA kinase
VKTFGLTGGIGTGKSTVAQLLRERHGVPILDADQVAREVVAKGTDGLTAVVDSFGPEVLDEDGNLDRARMRAIVMSDASARRRLESITHPRIFESIGAWVARQASNQRPLIGIEAALMVETGSWRMQDALVVVSASPDVQVARVMARDGVSEDAARAVLGAQLPMADKERVATYVVRNEGSLDDLTAAADALWHKLIEA